MYRNLFEYLFFSSLGYIPRSGIARSYSNSMFNFLRNFISFFFTGGEENMNVLNALSLE